MPVYKAKNSVTGEEVHFQWKGDEPPTEDDIARISGEQRDARTKLKQDQVNQERKPFFDRLVTNPLDAIQHNPVTDAAVEWGNNNLVWHPLDAAKEIGGGVADSVKAMNPFAPPEQQSGTAQLGAINKIIRGGMKLVGPPATVAGALVAPIPTAAALGGSYVGGKAAEALTPDDWSPEAKEFTHTAGSLVGGGLAAHQVNLPPGIIKRAPRAGEYQSPWSGVSSAEVYPWSMGKELPPSPKGAQPWTEPFEPRPTPERYAPPTFNPKPELPPATFITPPPAEPYSPPALSPAPDPPINYQYNYRPELPAGPPMRQLPERGTPIPMGAPPRRMPPAGTYQTQQNLLRGTELPAIEAPKDLVSVKHAEPVGPTDLPTVSAPEPPPSSVQPTTAAAPLPTAAVPPVGEPEVLPPPTVTAPQNGAPPPKVIDVPPVAPPPTGADLAKKALSRAIRPSMAPASVPPPAPVPPASAPVGPVAPPVPAAPPPAQAPPAQPDMASEIARLKAENDQLRSQGERTAVPAPVPPAPQPPQAPAQLPLIDAPGVKLSPAELAKRATAMLKAAKPTPAELPDVSAPGEAPPPPPPNQAAIKGNNDVLNFVKTRQGAKPSEIAAGTGVPLDQVKTQLGQMQKRGLIDVKGARVSYKWMAGEKEKFMEGIKPKAPSSATAEVTPQSEPGAPAAEETALTPYRQKRMSDLQEQASKAEDEGDDYAAEVMRKHLKDEEDFAKVERKGSPEAKATLNELDKTYQRIDELENKESDGKLSDDETTELGSLYAQANRFGTMLQRFLKDETGTSPDTSGPKRSFFARRAFRKGLERPGESGGPEEGKGIAAFGGKLRSANQYLLSTDFEGAWKIGRKTPLVENMKRKWISKYENQSVDIIKGLNKAERTEVFDILDKNADPEAARASNPKIMKAAVDLRDMLDDIFDQVPEGGNRGKDVGYLKGYVTHMKQQYDASSELKGVMQDMWRYHLKPFTAVKDLFAREEVPHGDTSEEPMGQYGTGSASSPFAKTRSGELTDIERDPKIMLPIYIESMAKLVHDKPWLDEAKAHLNSIPDSMTKELATSYLRNYARYDAYPRLHGSWLRATGAIGRMVSRSILGLDSRLFMLHGSRLFSNFYPEMPDKYFAHGMGQVIKHPIDSFTKTAELGMLPTEMRPWYLKRPMEKVDSVIAGMSLFDYFPDAVGFHGFKKMYMDRGIPANQAEALAVDKAMDVGLRITPARAAKFFSDDLGPLQPFTQFKQQIFKIAEQYATQPLDAVKKGDYSRLMRYVMGASAMIYLHKKYHISSWHLDPFGLPNFHSAAYERIGSVLTSTRKSLDPDLDSGVREKLLQKALTDAALLATPAALSLKKQFEAGQPSFIEPDADGSSGRHRSGGLTRRRPTRRR